MNCKSNMALFVLSISLTLSSCTRALSTQSIGDTSAPPALPSETFTPIPSPTWTSTPLPTFTPIPAARIESGDRAIFHGDWETALLEYRDAYNTSNEPEIKAAALLGIGRSYLYQENFYEAVIALNKLIEEFPETDSISQAHFFLSQTYLAQERFPEAIQAFSDFLNLNPGLIDAYILDMRGDALFSAGDYEGALNDFQAALLEPSLLDKTLLQLKLARAHALAGDYDTALVIYTDLYSITTDENTRALIDFRMGQAYTELGETELAYEAYMDAVENYPAAHESYLSLIELVNAGVEVDDLSRGIVDYYAGEYGVAIAAFNSYLQKTPSDPGSAHYFYGLSTRSLGGWQEAVERWDLLIEEYPDHPLWVDAWEQKAYTLWAFLDQYDMATQTFLDFVDSAPDHPRAVDFLFDAGLVAERAGDLELAVEIWKRVLNHYPNSDLAARAVFLAGITQFRLEDYQNALTSLQQFLSLATSLQDRSSANFWIGKIYQAMGNDEAARDIWLETSAIDPTGYYSERARDILHGRNPFSPPLEYDLTLDKEEGHKKAEIWMRATFGLADEINISGLGPLESNPNLLRGTELWNLGLYNEARKEFEDLRQSILHDAVGSYRLANYLVEIGAYRSAIIAARQVLDLALMDDASTLSAPLLFNHIRFGTYYKDIVMDLANQYSFHPLFLFSVIRQESLFEGFARSSADARGLMQVIPSTGIDIYENLGWPPNFTPDDLYRPIVSLTFGTDYLDTQRNSFDGDMYAALAAYNGGPGNAAQWKELSPNDPDLFLELIRTVETRNYIRGIYELFNIYRMIYDRTP